MRKLTQSQIKTAILAREKNARADSTLRKTRLARLQARRRQAEKILASHLKRTGFDFDAFDRIRAEQHAEMQRLLKEAETTATKRSSARNKDLAYGIKNWRTNIDATLGSQLVPAFEVVDKPFLIWPTNNLELEDSHIQPWNNTAKIRAQWRNDSGNENLRFIFVWENPSANFAIVNVESNLAVNGVCDAFAEGGFFAGSLNSVWVQASLNVWEWWKQPPTMLPPQTTQIQRVLAVSAAGGGFLSNLGGGNVDSASAAGIFDVRRTLFLLPPKGVAVFEVTLEFFYDNIGGGMIQVNFASGDLGVKCPAVVIAILS